MKRSIPSILGGAVLLSQMAHAGSRAGGNVTIPADTLGSGGGTANGDSVVVTSNLGGVIGTVGTASIVNQQGFIPQIRGGALSGFALWAEMNVGAGEDASFEGDADGNGIANGTEYVFGPESINVIADGARYSLPPTYPGDVTIILEFSRDLSAFLPAGEWNGSSVPTFLDPDLKIINDEFEVSDAGLNANPTLFFRYRLTQP